ncbi:hypothetical protein Dsin_027554 [Dipteronia sinensis]|uniref:Endonuclease/exonuclease/phosphatase domain-containing protein n=1 Tax=Dipteronia sinensis TaxID=43782 RepID=A0AAD9ZNP9_9ROSI|nr:hypothetical protein Dsin_027554 [Dipteronia sinensis]
MFLLETKCHHVKLEKWKVKLGFIGKLVVDCIGKARGLCLYWSKEVNVELLSYSHAHIDVRIRRINKQSWRFTGFYGDPDGTQRCHSWSLLKRLAGMSNLPWVCIGDFNEVCYNSEKSGGLRKR